MTRRYRPGQVPRSPDIGQTQRFVRKEFDNLAVAIDQVYEDIIYSTVGAGWGGIKQSLPNRPLGTLGATWTDYPFMDANEFAEDRGVITDLVAGTMGWTFPGPWQVNCYIELEFDEAQQGRAMGFRLHHAGSLTSRAEIDIGIGRNTTRANIILSSVVNVSDVAAQGQYQFIPQLSGLTDSFNNVIGDVAFFNTGHLGPIYSERYLQ